MTTRKKGGKPHTLDIRQLKIYVDISVPFSKRFLLTSDNLMYSGRKKLEKYPFFIDSEEYPFSHLITQKYDYIMEFFFVKRSFVSKMINFSQNLKPKTKKRARGKRMSGGNETRDKIGEKNFNLMLSLLFPTYYPIKNNIYNSYDIVTSQTIWLPDDLTDSAPVSAPVSTPVSAPDTDVSQLPNFYDMIKNTFSFAPQKMSYIKYETNTYTITEVIWLNDFLNYPIYNSLLKDYKYYEEKKKESETEDVNAQIIDKLRELIEANPYKIPIDKKEVYESEKNLDGLIEVAYSRDQDYSTSNKMLVNKLFKLIYNETDNQKKIELGEKMVNAFKEISRPNVKKQTIIIMSQLESLYDKTQIKVILKEFEKSFDTKYIGETEKRLLTKNFKYVLDLGNTIQKLKERRMSNSEITKIIERPKIIENGVESPKSLGNYIKFATSYQEGEGEESVYSNKDLKILFDRSIDSENKESNEYFIELYIIINVIENKYDPETINTIDCHYKDHELVVLKKDLVQRERRWNMEYRKIFFSDKKYKDEIDYVYNKIKKPIPSIGKLELDSTNLKLENDVKLEKDVGKR